MLDSVSLHRPRAFVAADTLPPESDASSSSKRCPDVAESAHVPAEGTNPANHHLPPLRQPPEKVVQVVSPPTSEPTSQSHTPLAGGPQKQIKVNAMRQLRYIADILSQVFFKILFENRREGERKSNLVNDNANQDMRIYSFFLKCT